MADTDSDWLPFTLGAVGAMVAALGAIAVAVITILPAGHIIGDDAPVVRKDPVAAITTPSPARLTTVYPSGVTVSGTVRNLPAGWSVWLLHQFPRWGHTAVGDTPLIVTDDTWTLFDRPFEGVLPGDKVNLQLLVAPPTCADAIREIAPNKIGRRFVYAMPPGCPLPVSVARLLVSPGSRPDGD